MSLIERAEQSLGLADDAMERSDVEGLVAHLSMAIGNLTAAGEPRRAAMACVRLGGVLSDGMGNLTAGRAWFSRAARLLEGEPACIEQGWVAVAAMGCDVADPARLLASAELALERARRFGDLSLETKALADAGLAHVQAGRLDEGTAVLDEAMALACGPAAADLDTAGRAACSFFTACYYAGDFERAASWADLLRRAGVIGTDAGAPIFLSSHCDAVQASLLCELGRWSEAELILTRAAAAFESAMGQPSWHPAIMLADLRIRQGRHVEAEMLLLGKDQAHDALLPAARLHLSRGDHDLAAATARRGLRTLGADRLRSVELLTVLIDAQLEDGDVDGATTACIELDETVLGLDSMIIRARAELARARVRAAEGQVDAAEVGLERSLDHLDARTSPWLCARIHIELARLREGTGDRAAAIVDARAACGLLARLDVVVPPDHRALLDRLVDDRGARSPSPVAELRRDGKWWIASCDGTQVRLPDTKGLRYLAELIIGPGVERHSLDLVDRIEGAPGPGGVDRRRLGDAGEVLDGRARADYRHRIEELRSECEESLAADDLDRAEALQGELDQLVNQLAHAFGLGGRSRRASSAAERARLNVTRALRAATAKLAEALPGIGDTLDGRVRTGIYCVYDPPDEGVDWIVQPSVNETTRD